MRNPSPRIVVLIPAYNAEGTINRAIQSLNANCEPHDIVVVDDGSLVPVENCIPPQTNLTIIRLEKNQGIIAALNVGLAFIFKKNYDYIARLDADDVTMPNRLALQRTFLDQHADIGLVGGWMRVLSENGKPLNYLKLPTDHAAIIRGLYYNNCIPHPGLMMRADLLRQIGMYRQGYDTAEDYDLIRRFARCAKLANLPYFLVDYTISTQGISQARAIEQIQCRLRVQWHHRNWLNIHFYIGILKTLAQSLLSFYSVRRHLKQLSEKITFQGEPPIYVWKPFRGQVVEPKSYDKPFDAELNQGHMVQIKPAPRIAVLIAAHNAEKTIGRAVQSLNANDEPHDIVIVDDGSRFPVRDILPLQPNLTVLRLEQNRGVTRALNVGLAHILTHNYDFVARMDADDVSAPHRLAYQREFLDQNTRVAIVGSWARIMSEHGKLLNYLNLPVDHDSIMRGLYYNNCTFHPSLMLRTSALRVVGAYSERYKVGQDYDLIRKLTRNYGIANIPRYLIDYTISSGGISQSRNFEQMKCRFLIQLAHRDLGNFHFYAGLAKTCALILLFPLTVWRHQRQLMHKIQSTGEPPVIVWYPLRGQISQAQSENLPRRASRNG